MKLTPEEARSVVWEDSEDWEIVSGPTTVDHTRWSVVYEAVCKHLPSGKFYHFYWERGATECQDVKPYEYEKEVEVPEVVEKEVVRKEWVLKDE